MKLFLILLFFSSQLFSDNFLIKDQVGEVTSIDFQINEYNFDQIDGYDRIISDTKGSILEYGHPELPTYSFNYAIENNKGIVMELIRTLDKFELGKNIKRSHNGKTIKFTQRYITSNVK